MDWEECNERGLVKGVSIDNDLVESLKTSSKKRLSSAHMLAINSTTASSVVSLCYESLRELLEALAIKNGFKIYNH